MSDSKDRKVVLSRWMLHLNDAGESLTSRSTLSFRLSSRLSGDMMDEFDIFDDIFSQPTEKPGHALCKFQPKAKKKSEQTPLPPTSKASTKSNVSEPNADICSNDQSNTEVSNNEDYHGISSNSLTEDVLITAKDEGLHAKEDKPQNEVELVIGDQQHDKTHVSEAFGQSGASPVCLSISSQTKEPMVTSEHPVRGHDNMELDAEQVKTGQDVADLFSNMDQFDDFNTQQTTCAARNLGKFKPKGKMIPKQKTLIKSTSSILSSMVSFEGPIMGLCNTLSVDKTSQLLLNESSGCVESSQTKAEALAGSSEPESHTYAMNETTYSTSVVSNEDIFYPQVDSYIRIPDSCLPDSSNFWNSEDPTCDNPQVDHVLQDEEDSGRKNTPSTLSEEVTEELHTGVVTGTNVGDGNSVEGGLSSRRQRKRVAVHSPVNDFEDDNVDFGLYETLQPHEADVDDEYTGEDPGIKKQMRQSAKMLSDDTPKAAQERKKSAQEPPKKKFLHSTRRKRRQVSMELLATPDEEIDERRLPIKDLILLTEAREKMAIKDEIASKQSSAKKSSSRQVPDNNVFAEDMYSEGQYPNPDDDENGIDADEQLCETTVNHHSFMKKKRSSKWSKLDTSLFYQAVRQFGTDFSMIQQLFPNRTRHQVKLKFNNEDRKHPLQIADALFHRSKDVSQFERVIRQLEAQKAKNPDDDTTVEDQTAVAPESQDTATRNENQHEEENDKPEYGGEQQQGVSDDLKYSEYEDVFDFSEIGVDDVLYTGKEDDYGI